VAACRPAMEETATAVAMVEMAMAEVDMTAAMVDQATAVVVTVAGDMEVCIKSTMLLVPCCECHRYIYCLKVGFCRIRNDLSSGALNPILYCVL